MKKGFTLIELLIVVAIIGILAAIAVPNFLNARMRARVTDSISSQRTYKTIQKMYLMDYGDIPGHLDAKEEHCPYINLGYISAPLDDVFQIDVPGRASITASYTGGMHHSAVYGDPPARELQAANPHLWEEWRATGYGYIIWGLGPARDENWTSYNPSNGLVSSGMINTVGVRGKGNPVSNLPYRECN